MKQVTNDQFYAFVGPLDAIISIDASYSSIYKMRHNDKVIGKVVESPIYWEAAIGQGNTYFISR